MKKNQIMQNTLDMEDFSLRQIKIFSPFWYEILLGLLAFVRHGSVLTRMLGLAGRYAVSKLEHQ